MALHANEKQDRVVAANKMIQAIAENGRRFSAKKTGFLFLAWIKTARYGLQILTHKSLFTLITPALGVVFRKGEP